MDEREKQKTLEELQALRLTREYQALATGTATPHDVATLLTVQEHFAWRAAGRPGSDPAHTQADLERVEHELRAFAEGYIPQWLAAEFPPSLRMGRDALAGFQPEGWPEPPVACFAIGSPPRIFRLSDGYLLDEDGEWKEPEPGGDVIPCLAFGSTILRQSAAATLQPDGSWKPAPRDPDLLPNIKP